MNTGLFFLGLLEFILSLGIVVLVLYLSYQLLRYFFLRKGQVSYSSVSFGIVTAGVFFSVTYLMSAVRGAMIEVVRVIYDDPDYPVIISWEALQNFLLFMLMALVVIVLANLSSFALFSWMTKGVDEVEEIKKDNVAVSIISAMLLICISLMVKDSLVMMMQSLIPYPELPNIY